MAAVNSRYRDDGPLIGVRPGRRRRGPERGDRTAIVFRRGRVVFRIGVPRQATARCRWPASWPPSGATTGRTPCSSTRAASAPASSTACKELNVPVVGINNAERANDATTYDNHRAEMWWLMKQWLEDAPCRLPNNAALIADLTGPQPKESSNGRKLLEKKADMAKRGVRSPDGGDALALTFAHPVVPRVGSATHDGAAFRGSREAPTSAGY
jgi:hypothetical protein